MSGTAPALPRQVLLSLTTALVAAGLVIGMFETTKTVAALVVGTLGLVILFLASGNHRLFCLWAVVIMAPITLAKNFALLPHMGGAGSFSIEPIDPFMLLLIFFMLRDKARGYGHEIRFSPLALWWGGMIALGLVNAAFGPMRIAAAEEVVRMVKCYLIFFVIVNEVVRVRRFYHLVAAIALGIALQSCTGIVQGLFRTSLGLQALGEATQETIQITSQATYAGGGNSGFRINGLLGHPNLLAAYLSMFLPLCIALLFGRIPVKVRILLGGITSLGLLALIMTLSRTGWLTFGVAFLVLFGLSFVHPRLRRRFLFARVTAIVGLVLVVVAFMPQITKRLYDSDPGALNFRYEWMDVAWQMVLEKPLTGFGLNTFIYHLPGRTRYGGVAGMNDALGKDWPAVHNVWLLTWSEQGTLGFICFAGMHFYLLAVGLRNTRCYYNDVLFAVNLGCLCGVVSIMIDGISSIYVRSPAPARMFWVLAGLMVAVDYWNRANAPRRLAGTAAPANQAEPAPQLA